MAYLKLADHVWRCDGALPAAGAVDQESMPAATARQMLLTTSNIQSR
jgi:hypothetical protein